jgi:hypothetical protein
MRLKLLRIIATSLPQLLILLDLGARFDLILGFNRTDYGFATLLFLFVVTPLMNLVWLLIEIMVSLRLAKRAKRPMPFLMPGVALLCLVESLLIDILLLSQARM